MFGFNILAKDNGSRARSGVIETPHGTVETPAYTIVGTNAAVRTLKPEDLPWTKTKLIIANTYHLWRELGEKLDAFEGLHKRMGFEGTIMTDSGGFQVFSLGFAREHGVGKIANIFPGIADERISFGTAVRSLLRRAPTALSSRRPPHGGTKPSRLREIPQDTTLIGERENLVSITDEGVHFRDGDRDLFLNPEISIGIQEKLGADIVFAFDECTSPLNDYDYTKRALARTHAWAKRSLAAQTRSDQALYGIVQGGEYRDLREESARFIGVMSFPGFGIGGSLGKSKEDMWNVLKWTLPLLPEEKPRHLLGIGRIDDVLNGIELGVDTFDCVIPTREARHGSIWTHEGRYDVKSGRWAESRKPLEKRCTCPVCSAGRTRGEINALFKGKDHEAGRLATIHNVYFFNDLMRQAREAIRAGKFGGFKKKTLRDLG